MSKPTQKESTAPRTTLFATDASNSVLTEINDSGLNQASYSAYGHYSSDAQPSSNLGFNGEMRDPITSCYFLGNGNRVYNPVLMRFHSPDMLSPFYAGGLNAYMYCIGDPINHSDPTGNFPIWARIVGGLASAGIIVGAVSAATDGDTRTILGAIALTAIVGASGLGGYKLSRTTIGKSFGNSSFAGKKAGYRRLSTDSVNPQQKLRAGTTSSIKPIKAIPVTPSDPRAVTTIKNAVGTAPPERPNYWREVIPADEAFRRQVRLAEIQGRVTNNPGGNGPWGLAARRAMRRPATGVPDGVSEAQRIRRANLFLEI